MANLIVRLRIVSAEEAAAQFGVGRNTVFNLIFLHTVFYSFFSYVAEKIKGLRYEYLIKVDALARPNIRPSYRKVK